MLPYAAGTYIISTDFNFWGESNNGSSRMLN